jgi:hypothetical protein
LQTCQIGKRPVESKGGFMSKTNLGRCENREPQVREISRNAAGFDVAEDTLLTIARSFFQSYAIPESQSWMSGYDIAEAAFGAETGSMIATRMFSALRAVRHSRRSVFCFNSPTCQCCAQVVTEHERRLMQALQSIRCNQMGRAQAELMMLCEGNSVSQVIGTLVQLSMVLPPRVEQVRIDA